MKINQLTKKINLVSEVYANRFNIKRNNDWYMLKIQEELGELTQRYLMLSGKKRLNGRKVKEVRNEFEQEVADLFCHVILLASFNKVDLMKTVREKWFSHLEMNA